MDKILRDIKKIIDLAKKANQHIEEKKIRNVKRDINKIIKFDLDELSRIKKEHGIEGVFEECLVVLHNAKVALIDISHKTSLDTIKKLIDEIINIEGHELLEVTENTRLLNLTFNYWHKYIRNSCFYHGTNSVALPKIKKYGLVPGMLPWDRYDFDRVHKLMLKSGYKYGMTVLYHSDHVRSKSFYITNSKSYAEMKSPEIWNTFVGERAWMKGDYKQAMLNIYLHIADKGILDSLLILNKGKLPKEEDYIKIRKYLYGLFYSNFRKFRNQIGQYISLDNKEIKEIFRIFRKYWILFSNAKPVMISIDPSAPAINDFLVERFDCNPIKSYNGFFHFFKDELVIFGDIKNIKDLNYGYNSIMNFRNIEVEKRIHPKYFIKAELV